ncbi:uncharacterized protein C16orf74 homolog isoform 2-T2 [Alca torda]
MPGREAVCSGCRSGKRARHALVLRFSTSGQDRRWGWRAGSRSEDENMGLKLSCLKGLKTCVSSENGTGGTPSASSGEKHLHVPSIIVTPPTPTGTTLSRDSRRVGGSPPCSQC